MATDPVCGMFVDDRRAEFSLVRENRRYVFCSASCLHEFAEPEAHLRRLRYRLIVAWPLSAVVLALTYGVSASWAPYAALPLAAVVQAYAGAGFYAGTRDAIRARVWNMDVLIAVGTTTAFLYSAAVLVPSLHLPSAVYFDASSLIVTLILTGNYLEQLTRGRASAALRRLTDLLPTTVVEVRDGRESESPLRDIAPGAILRVRPGGRIPVDGVVVAGASAVDESLVTGESVPIEKGAGHRVVAGSMNVNGLLDIRATGVGSDTFVAEVGRLLADAEMSQVPLRQTADKIAERFVPAVLALGLVASFGWRLAGAEVTVAVLVFVSVVITACPCAFGIATPAALIVGAGKAADRGVVFRGRDAIERASEVDLVLTDKTGTLTRGKPRLTDVVPLGATQEADLLAWAAAVERASEHPLARATVEAAEARGVSPALVTEARADPGIGMSGIVDGSPISIQRIGSGPAASSPPLDAAVDRLTRAGRTISVVSKDGAVVGLLGYADDVGDGVSRAVQELRGAGIRVVMATGDRRAVAEVVARAAGIEEVHAGLDPAAKVWLLRELQSSGRRVAFVGDGINDAPALAAAHLGIAIGTGTEVAKEAGQVLLLRSDFSGVPTALRIARRTVGKVRQNLGWAVGYNLLLLPIAAGALVPVFGFGVYGALPIVGAVAMAFSSTTVVLNSLSLRRG
jgi:P-type Cu+ transporter